MLYFYFTFLAYLDIGDPMMQCKECYARMWYDKRMLKSRHVTNPKFTLDYSNETVQLPLLQQPPPPLQHILFDQFVVDSKHF